MGFEGCKRPGGRQCVIKPHPAGDFPAFSASPLADGFKAAYVPAMDCIYVERAFWNVQTLDCRAWTYFHELGHKEGAQCEPCADHRAGEHLRQIGWGSQPGESVDGALWEVIGTLQNRDPIEAARAVCAGFEGRGLDGQASRIYNTRTAKDGKGRDLLLCEVRPDTWVAGADVQDWEDFFSDIEALNIPYTVDSSFRDQATQIRIWKERHDDASPDGQFDVNAPRNARWISEGPVAIPGVSEHQYGKAIDLAFPTDESESSGSPRNQAARIAESHDIYRDATAERWHFAHGGKRKFPIAGDDAIANSEASARDYWDRVTGEGAGSESNPDPASSSSRGAMLAAAALLIWIFFG